MGVNSWEIPGKEKTSTTTLNATILLKATLIPRPLHHGVNKHILFSVWHPFVVGSPGIWEREREREENSPILQGMIDGSLYIQSLFLCYNATSSSMFYFLLFLLCPSVFRMHGKGKCLRWHQQPHSLLLTSLSPRLYSLQRKWWSLMNTWPSRCYSLGRTFLRSGVGWFLST